MKIGIINAGNIGLNLAVGWVRHGHDIMLSKDTHPEQLRERARTLALGRGLSETELSRFRYGSMADAAQFGDIAVMAVYFPRLENVLEQLRKDDVTLSGKIVIDTMNPLNVDVGFNHFHDLKFMEQTSVTERLQREFPDAILFKAFNNFPAGLLDITKWSDGHYPSIVFIGGNSVEDAAQVRALIETSGFKPQFAGHNLSDSRILEKLGILMHLLADNEYGGDTGIAISVFKSPSE
ncbi:unnamed protein product [Clonostachys chloroleuca]|uniref:Pyrroline-5-carboxylate reductase catalytic N-terminal domain-containing protein n=1 Tax=Clonostachys chloroleuca TaxID=1926264 RepID=A0AA35Q7D4_9HYPO|nr:unnamed protein product [Clonostachys chloroleuca]